MPFLIPLALWGAGQLLNVIGNVKQGNAAREAGEAEGRAYDSDAARLEFNAKVADLQASDAVARGQQEESLFRQQVRALMGRQRTGSAGAGLDIGVGSAVDIAGNTAHLGELDALTIRNNAAREAWAHQMDATDLRLQSEVATLSGRAARTGGRVAQRTSRINAATGVLGSGSQLLLDRYGWRIGPRGPATSPTVD
jgi:hypothetical protein